MNFLKKIGKKVEKAADKIEEKAKAEVTKVSGADDGSRDVSGKPSGNVNSEEFQARAAEAIPGDVKMISGCKDEQTSADVYDVAKFGLPDSHGAGGACTNALLKSLQPGDSPTWVTLLQRAQQILKTEKFTQVPQLSTSRSLNLNDKFDIRPGKGNNKSLFIGINYIGQKGELRGCHNDVSAMKNYVLSQGFHSDGDHSRTLVDNGRDINPTGANILQGFAWLVEGAKAGDDLFMHYSGHGGSVPDDDGDEADKMDETLVPVDYMEAGQIRDDDIFDWLVKKIPAGCHLTVIMDCCHSGSILDLPYTLKGDESTMQQVQSGQLTSTQPNPSFTGRFIKLGMELIAMKMSGADFDKIKSHALRSLVKR